MRVNPTAAGHGKTARQHISPEGAHALSAAVLAAFSRVLRTLLSYRCCLSDLLSEYFTGRNLHMLSIPEDIRVAACVYCAPISSIDLVRGFSLPGLDKAGHLILHSARGVEYGPLCVTQDPLTAAQLLFISASMIDSQRRLQTAASPESVCSVPSLTLMLQCTRFTITAIVTILPSLVLLK